MARRYRLYPSEEQDSVFRRHCGEARFVWNLALEQFNQWRPGRRSAPGSAERFRQLAEARQETWLGAGSSTVQQQALRDFDQALANWRRGSHRRPTWRRRGPEEGFCIRDVHVRKLSGKWAEVAVPKASRVRFRLSRPIPKEPGMARVTLDGAGRWHVSFPGPQTAVRRQSTGTAVGVDRGVATTLAGSDGTFLRAPRMGGRQERRLVRLQQRLCRQRKGSIRRRRTKAAIARVHQRQGDRLRDWTERQTTRLVRAHDVVAVEALEIRNMVRRPESRPDCRGGFAPNGARAKARLNRAIHRQGWGRWLRRLEEKAAAAGVQVVEVPAHHTSQTCRACGVIAAESRESQSTFRCITCGHVAHADRNAADNILARGLALLVPAHTPGPGACRPHAGARGSRQRGAARTTRGLR
jgi:transposase